jgi:hypothetical protein
LANFSEGDLPKVTRSNKTSFRKPIHRRPNEAGVDFLDIFFRGKSLAADFSLEFLGKTIFQNFCPRKISISPNIFRGKNIRGIFRENSVLKTDPRLRRKKQDFSPLAVAGSPHVSSGSYVLENFPTADSFSTLIGFPGIRLQFSSAVCRIIDILESKAKHFYPQICFARSKIATLSCQLLFARHFFTSYVHA